MSDHSDEDPELLSDVQSSGSDGEDDQPPQPLHRNYFAPPFYGKPPSPLPPSPSLISLVARASRPTTPDASDDELEPVPRASPRVPTYEYYGFVLYLFSSFAFLLYLLWAFLPSPFLHALGIYYYPNRWWALAVPAFITMTIVYIYIALALYNTEYLTLSPTSIETIVDEAANIATIDSKGKIRPSAERSAHGSGRKQTRLLSETKARELDWGRIWAEGTDAVMDVPLAGVNELLYGNVGDEEDED